MKVPHPNSIWILWYFDTQVSFTSFATLSFDIRVGKISKYLLFGIVSDFPAIFTLLVRC